LSTSAEQRGEKGGRGQGVADSVDDSELARYWGKEERGGEGENETSILHVPTFEEPKERKEREGKRTIHRIRGKTAEEAFDVGRKRGGKRKKPYLHGLTLGRLMRGPKKTPQGEK